MLERARRDERWRMRLLEFDNGDVDPFYAHPLFAGGAAIGIVSSGIWGQRLQKAIGLAWLRQPVTEGAGLEVEILGRRVGARITAAL